MVHCYEEPNEEPCCLRCGAKIVPWAELCFRCARELGALQEQTAWWQLYRVVSTVHNRVAEVLEAAEGWVWRRMDAAARALDTMDRVELDR